MRRSLANFKQLSHTISSLKHTVMSVESESVFSLVKVFGKNKFEYEADRFSGNGDDGAIHVLLNFKIMIFFLSLYTKYAYFML